MKRDFRVLANTLGLAPSDSVLVVSSVPVSSFGSGGSLVQPNLGSVSVSRRCDGPQVQPLRPRIQAGKVAPPSLHT